MEFKSIDLSSGDKLDRFFEIYQEILQNKDEIFPLQKVIEKFNEGEAEWDIY